VIRLKYFISLSLYQIPVTPLANHNRVMFKHSTDVPARKLAVWQRMLLDAPNQNAPDD